MAFLTERPNRIVQLRAYLQYRSFVARQLAVAAWRTDRQPHAPGPGEPGALGPGALAAVEPARHDRDVAACKKMADALKNALGAAAQAT